MFNLEFTDWLFLAASILLIVAGLTVLKTSYATKSYLQLPSMKPKFCLLPKYAVSLPLENADPESDLSSRLAHYGFSEKRRDDNVIVFSRGSELGDFSIKIAKLVVSANRPISNPVQLDIKYGVAFGCAFDTGDLWMFCHELTEKIEATKDRQNTDLKQTDNPYRSPQR